MSRRALSLSLLSMLLLVGLALLRDHLVVQAPMTAIVFDHQDHYAVKCITCHHNFFDRTGQDSCYFCHKKRPALARTVEHDFHHLCRDCHASVAAQGYASGPIRRCASCHDWKQTQRVVPIPQPGAAE